MSLINDALKKAQAELKQQTASNYSSHSGKSKPGPRTLSRPAKVVLTLGSVLVISSMALLIALLTSPTKLMEFVYPEHQGNISTSQPKPLIANIDIEPIYTNLDFENDEVTEETLAIDEEPLPEVINSEYTKEDTTFTNLLEAADSMLVKSQVETPDRDLRISINESPKPTFAKKENKTTVDPTLNTVNKLAVTGVMFSGETSKVIINNRVYTVNSVVHENPQLILKQVTPHEIVLADSSGIEYTKAL